MSTKYLGDTLPEDASTWKTATGRYAESGSIHELKSARSASEITVEQFLSLRVLWKSQTAKQLNDDKRAGLYGSSKNEIQDKVTRKPEHEGPWQEYLKAIPATQQAGASGSKLRRTSKMPEKLGVYALVLQAQLEASEMEASFSDSNKLMFTPLPPRYDLRGRPQDGNQGIQGKGKGKEPMAQSQDSPPVSEKSKASSGARHISPMPREVARDFPIVDEQIVNTAAINFLNALFIHNDRPADWTLQRKQFKFKSEFVKFEARTDGHYQVHNDNRSAAILEVKPRSRYLESGFRIEMQESAQMALWIYQEPNSHWAPPTGGDTY
jgi:hypothetical protein